MTASESSRKKKCETFISRFFFSISGIKTPTFEIIITKNKNIISSGNFQYYSLFHLSVARSGCYKPLEPIQGGASSS